MKAKDKVALYISQRFEYDKLIDMPVVPGGTRVVLKDGSELLVSYDFLTNEIIEHLPAGERRVPWFVVSGEDPQGYYPGGL